MPRVTVNMEGVESSFTPPAEGPHEFAITDAKLREGKATGNPYITWELTVQEGDDTGKKVFFNTMLAPKEALWNLKRFLEAVKGENIPQSELDIDTDDYVGEQVIGYVVHEHAEYKGRDIINVSFEKFEYAASRR